MDKARVYGTRDSRFDPWQNQLLFGLIFYFKCVVPRLTTDLLVVFCFFDVHRKSRAPTRPRVDRALRGGASSAFFASSPKKEKGVFHERPPKNQNHPALVVCQPSSHVVGVRGVHPARRLAASVPFANAFRREPRRAAASIPAATARVGAAPRAFLSGRRFAP